MIEQQRQILFDKREDVLKTAAAVDFFESRAPEKFAELKSVISTETLDGVCRHIVLSCIDTSWSQYLAEIADIREGIHLHRVGGQDPYVEFQKLVVVKFAELLPAVEERAIHIFAAMQVSGETLKNRDDQRLKTPSATMFGNIGVSTGAAVMWPLMVLSLLVNTIVSRLRRNTHHASKEKNMS